MVKIVNKKTICVDVADLSLDMLKSFFSKYNAIDKAEFVYLVYHGQDFLTCVSYRDVAMFCEEEELEFFLRYANIYTEENVYFTEKEAEQIFRESKYVYHYVLAEKPIKNRDYHMFYEKNPLIEKEIIDIQYAELYELLKKKGVNIYRVRIPSLNEIHQHETFNYVLSDKWLTLDSAKDILIRNIVKITGKSTTEVTETLSQKKPKERMGRGKKKIYLVGPCLVAGWINFEDEELAFTLADMLSKRGYEYEVIKILQTRTVEDSLCRILCFNIFMGDIVIILDDLLIHSELDLKLVYDDYKGNEWLYTDIPIHTTKRGNELIAETLIDKIIVEQNSKDNDIKDDVCLHKKQRILRYDEEQEIATYLESIAGEPVKTGQDNKAQIGAIVMNANPFTLGHRYLVETAKAHVDFLYIFVVEEDSSYFPFQDRFKMVQEGLKDIKQVAVVPSGKFIISQGTFKSYFEKEIKPDLVIDAGMDIWIFAQYIAPYIGITKRFVGEEPFDNITMQYNEQMKLLLPDYGIDLIEIPRRKLRGGVNQVISASAVRNLIEKNDWEQIGQMVPHTTLEWIQRCCTKSNPECKNQKFSVMKQYIGSHDNIIVYGTGNSTAKLMDDMDLHDISKIIFCDKKASSQEYLFQNRKVISPEELYQFYRGYNILVTSSIYSKEIYMELRHHGIEADKIWCNTL